MEFGTILVGIILVNNYVLAQFLGICPFLGVSKKLDSAVGMGVAVIFVMVLATAATWPVMQVLNSLNIGYLQTIAFILIIAALVQFVEMALKKFIPALHKSLGVYLPLITTNCAVLGVALTNVQKEYVVAKMGAMGFVTSVVNGLATAVGFTIPIVLLAGIRERIAHNDVPKAFQGAPIVLITACLMAIAFFGFSGLI